MRWLSCLLWSALLAAATLVVPREAAAQDKVLASVNGRPIMESELRLADAEIGADLGSLPDATKRRVLVEYLIETQLMAEAAEAANLGKGASFDQRIQYWRRRALRDSFFESRVKSLVTEAEARRSYDAQVSQVRGQVEVRASHILLASEDKAKEVFEKIAHGADFAEMARQFSIDAGSRDTGGSLGTFTRGQMAPQFEAAAFGLKQGEVSFPVQTQSGWHLIRLDDRRERAAPDFDSVKGRITAQLIHQRTQDMVDQLRARARIEYVDAALKAEVEAERKGAGSRQ